MLTIEQQQNETTPDPASMRLELIGTGWRTMDLATDPRRGPGTEGAEITIGYWPQFGALGVGTAMVREGRHEAPGAAYTEAYRRSSYSWLPVD